jgi:hypothetical protein
MNRIVVIFLMLAATAMMAQKKYKAGGGGIKAGVVERRCFSNLKFRSIGPAFMAEG